MSSDTAAAQAVDYVIDGRKRRLRVMAHRGPMPARGRVLALHGFTGTGADFAWPAYHALPQWDWLCPDLPGHGGSCDAESPDSCSLAATDAWITTLLQARPEPGALLVVGYSMGGRAALSLAATGSLAMDGLVLISGSAGLQGEQERQRRRAADELLARELEAKGIGPFLKCWAAHPLIATQSQIPPAIRGPMQTARQRQSPAGLAASLRGIGAGTLAPVWELLEYIKVTVLLVSGAQDVRYGELAANMACRIPAASHRIIPGAGHMAHLENPDAFAAVLQNFCRQIARD